MRKPSFTCFMHKIPSKAFLVSILVSASQALKVCYAHTHNDSVLKEMSHQGVVTELSQLTNSLIFIKGLRSLTDVFGRVYWFSTILTGQLHYIDALPPNVNAQFYALKNTRQCKNCKQTKLSFLVRKLLNETRSCMTHHILLDRLETFPNSTLVSSLDDKFLSEIRSSITY